MNCKRFLFALIAAASWIVSYAQAPLTWATNPNFGHGYPMITSFRDWYIYPEQSGNGKEEIPMKLLDFIIRVNGKDVVKENGLEEFNKSNKITVEYVSWPDDEVKSFTFYNGLYNDRNDSGDMRSLILYDIVPLYRYLMPGMSIVTSKNVDFSDFRTYDFLIEGNDPLVDEELLNEFIKGIHTLRMKRDTENPDVIFRIAKSTDQSFSTTYIPPTQQVVGTITRINPVYNYLTRTTSYEARQRVQTIENAGRTETTKVADVYLEIVALDAKKLNDPAQTTPPEIWKMTYTSNDVNDSRTPMQRYKAIVDMTSYPFANPTPFMIGAPLYTGASLVPSNDKKSLTVTEVAPNSPAAKLGLMPGDKILKVNGKNEFKKIMHSSSGWTVGEDKVLLADLPKSIAEAANVIFLRDYDPAIKEKLNFLVKINFKGLNKDKDNEFLIERDGKKIKLKGQLWYEQFYDMDPASFRKWNIDNNSLRYILSPQ